MARLQWQLGGIDGLFFPKTDEAILDAPAAGKDEAPQRDGMSLFGHALKRSFDIVLSAFLLVLFSPLIAVCAFMIKREDGGPVIFAQERVGRGGQPFNIYKFRSMRMDAEPGGTPALYSGEEDPRLTRVGRFLRAHHLDELPQLWNVLRGDMSFIGYRPERQFYIDQIMARNARYRFLYQIRPGVTSYATLYNGYTDTLEKMLARLDLDLYYLRNHSVWFDVKVLGLTFLSIVSGKKF
ncbi:MAG: sugar transferase [Bacteroidales bacterium]|nr:sugar transferase [Bacteroidales bacterium]